MLTLTIAAAFFAFWTFTGFAFLALVRVTDDPTDWILLSPAVGLAIIVLPVFWLNQNSVPVESFGRTLAIIVAALAIITLLTARPRIPWKALLFGSLVCTVALLLVGWPALRAPARGLDWLSVGNDDMINYVLAANFRIHDGFPLRMTPELATAGTDYSRLIYWGVNRLFTVRPGSELLVAEAVTVTGLLPYQAFMPTILALHLVLICSVGALVGVGRAKRAALIAMVMSGLSPLIALGTILQLIAQVGGLALLSTSAAVGLRASAVDSATIFRRAAVLSLVASALLVFYAEITPVFVLAFIFYKLIELARNRDRFQPILLAVVGTLSISVVLLNWYILDSVRLVLAQFTRASKTEVTALFPQYLMPSGLAAFWGLQDLDHPTGDPWLSLSIGVGIVLFVGFILMLVYLLRTGDGAAVLGLAFGLLAIVVIAGRDGFGLFKLAMFVQPAVIALFAIWLNQSRLSNVARLVPLVALLAIWARVEIGYAQRAALPDRVTVASAGPGMGAPMLLRSTPTVTSGEVIFSDTIDSFFGKLQAVSVSGHPLLFASRDFFSPFGVTFERCDEIGILQLPEFQVDEPIFRSLCAVTSVREFTFADRDGEQRIARFRQLQYGSSLPPAEFCHSYARTSPKLSLFNGLRQSPISPGASVEFEDCSTVRNHAILIHSDLGRLFNVAFNGKDVSQYERETDPITGGPMAAVGRYLLIEVFNPSDRINVAMNVSASFQHDGANTIPPARVIGDRVVHFPIVGKGAARVVSDSLGPREINGRYYILIDMGVDGRSFPEERSGLMNLFGSDIRRDPREIVAFSRDISLLSDDDLETLGTVSRLAAFPNDLMRSSVLYSGLYEDGWASNQFYAVLRQPTSASTVSVRGEIPVINGPEFTTQATLSVDGQPLLSESLRPGPFNLSTGIVSEPGLRKVEVTFSEFQRLPGDDGRPVSAQLAEIEIQRADTEGAGLTLGAGWYGSERFDGETFRWVGGDAQILIGKEERPSNVLELEVALGPSADPSRFALALMDQDGTVLGRTPVTGRQVVQFTVPDWGSDLRTLTLHPEGTNGGPASAEDPRQLDFRVFRMGWAAPVDITGAGLTLGAAWNQYETFEGESFRWVGGEAELVVAGAGSLNRVLELEAAPGPGMDGSTLDVVLVDDRGNEIGREPLRTRRVVRFQLPQTTSSQSLRLRAEGVRSGLTAPGDSRQLDFRVFKMSLRTQS